jgi:hypothetical protein
MSEMSDNLLSQIKRGLCLAQPFFQRLDQVWLNFFSKVGPGLAQLFSKVDCLK